MAEARDVATALGLGQHDTVEAGLHHGGEVGERQAGIERIDAHEERPIARARVRQRGGDVGAGAGFFGRGDGIFEVEDQRIGAAALALASLRSESPGTNSIDLSFMRPLPAERTARK